MVLWMASVVDLAIAYLFGATPTGYLAGRLLKGIDIREHGSRSTGATNVLRTLGKGQSSAQRSPSPASSRSVRCWREPSRDSKSISESPASPFEWGGAPVIRAEGSWAYVALDASAS